MNQSRKMARTLLLSMVVSAISTAAFLVSGCGNKSVVESLDCTPDQALINEGRECLATDQCPCGSHCSLGWCSADCLESGDCGEGQTCDLFGYCRAPDQETMPRISTKPEGTLAAEPISIEVGEASEVRQITVSASNYDIDKVRVAAEEGLEVNCGQGSRFSAECTIDDLKTRSAAQVRVRATGSLGADESRIIRLFAGEQQRLTVTYTWSATRPDSVVQGLYRGVAKLVSIDSGAGLRSALPGPSLNVSAEVFELQDGSSRIALHDDLGWMLPKGQLVGDIVRADSSANATADGGANPNPGLSLSFEPFSWIEGAISETDAVAVRVEPIEAPLSIDGISEQTLSFDLPLAFGGVVADATAGDAVWNVTLSFSESLSKEQAAAVPEADPPFALTSVDPTSRLGWENAVLKAIGEKWSGTLVQQIENRDEIATCKSTDRERLRDLVLAEGFAPLLQAEAQAALPGSSGSASVSFASPLPATFTSGSGEKIPSSVPCHLRFSYPAYDADPDCGQGQLAPFIDDEDLCDEFATRFRCDVIDLEIPLGEKGPSVSFDVSASSNVSSCTYTVEAAGKAEVRKVCRLPVIPHDCPEIALCYDSGDAAADPVSAVLQESLPKKLPALSGDLACQQGSRSAEVEADRRLGSEDGTLRLSAQQMFEACANDLGRLQDPVPRDNLDKLFVTQGCIDVARRLFAMGMVADMLYEPGGLMRDRNSTLLLRMAQQWFHTLSFLARESRMRESLGPAVHMESGADASNWVGASRVIDLLLAGFQPFLHPRLADALVAMPDRLVASPDYRSRVIPGEEIPQNPNHEQAVGLPVAMLESLGSLIELVEVRLEQARYTGDQAALQQAALAFRYSLPLRALAESLYGRAAARAGGSLPWSFRYQTARSALDATLERAPASARALHENRNPLGIEDSDLPLYFMEQQGDLSATQRFSAISDFLLGDGLGSTAWAPSFVEAAGEALDAARTAWLAQQDRELQNANVTGDLQERILALKDNYGAQLVDLCGNVEGVSTRDMLDWSGFDAQTCYHLSGDENSKCGLTSRELADRESKVLQELNQEDVAYMFCLARELAARTGSSAGFVDRKLQSFDQACHEKGGEPVKKPCPDEVTADNPQAVCVECLLADPKAEFCFSNWPNPDICSRLFSITTVGSLQISAQGAFDEIQKQAQAACGDAPELPVAVTEREVPDLAECYRGAIGEAALTVEAIAKELEVARSELADHQDAYDVVMKSCLIKQLGGKQLEQAQEAHNKTMSNLREQKRDADIAAAWASGTKDCLSALSGASGGALLSGGASLGLAAGACAAAMAEAGAKTASLVFEKRMEDAEADHEALMMKIENDISNKACFNDAELELVGTRTKSLAVQRAVIDLELALLRFNEAKKNATALYNEGRAEVAALKGRTIWPKQYDFWIHQDVETFKNRMTLAKRLTYLAVLAVEYEYQQSLTGESGGLRQATLAAELPSELEAVLTDLWQTSGTRAIHGNRPTDLKAVMSLRDQLLQLADHSDLADNELRLSPAQRFRLLLMSPSYRVFDKDGKYLGQQIPFNIAPLGALNLGQWEGIPLFAQNDCAERLWSVNASIIGGRDSAYDASGSRDDLFRGSAQTFVRLDLLKANTFYSNWCGSAPKELGPFQIASVRPSRNLFRGVEEAPSRSEGEENQYSRARIEAYFNVPRKDFEADEYASGDTSELACRGLYGSYALFIPAGVLSLQQADGSYTNGLNLEEVDDILLRMDYLSVAK